MTDEWTLKTKAMDIQTVSTALSEETCLVDNEECIKVGRGLETGGQDSPSQVPFPPKSQRWG